MSHPHFLSRASFGTSSRRTHMLAIFGGALLLLGALGALRFAVDPQNVLGVLSAQAAGNTYYISPTGSDSNAGTSAAPWKTFAYAIPRLYPGDTLTLADGTYTRATTGFPNIICTSGARNGTASAPITLRAQNERKAFLNGDGASNNVKFTTCSYWSVIGLYLRQIDNSSSGQFGNILALNSDHITVQRNLSYGNNRYFNDHSITFENSHYGLIEDNEVYFYHRHGISLGAGSSNNTVRRNYVNSRNAVDVCGAYVGGPACNGDSSLQSPTMGDEGITVGYPGSYNLIENNIIEKDYVGFAISALGTTIGNKLFGNIVMSGLYGFGMSARGSTLELTPRDTYYENNISLPTTYLGIYPRGAKNTIIKNMTTVGSTANSGVTADRSTSWPGDSLASTYITNSLSINNALQGFNIFAALQPAGWSINYSNAYNNAGGNYSPAQPNANITNSLSINPNLGTCKAWIPDSSPMKGAGLNGADIGANVLYRYVNGVLTTQPLWNTSTGEFPHGAIVPGVNDIAGQSAFDVHQRLNVNTNGCAFPAGYASGSPTPMPTPIPSVTPKAYTAPQISSIITIDGNLTESVWASAPSTTFQNSTYSDNTVTVKMLWDTAKLYLSYAVTDANRESPSTALYQNDGAEFYLDTANNKSTTMDTNDYSFITTLTDQVSNPGIASKAIQNATGYTMEIQVPWTLIATTPTANKVLGLLLANNDRDNGMSKQFDWQNVISTGSYNHPDLWGSLTLGAPLADPVAHWKFDEVGGATVFYDSSGNGLNGTCSGTACPTAGSAGKFANAVSFDGVADYVTMGTPASLNIIGTGLTISGWAKASAPGNFKYLVSKTNAANRGFALYTGANGSIRLYVGNGSTLLLSPDVASPWDNQWHHIVGVYDGSSLKMYIDGVERASGAATGNIANSSADAFEIGRFPGSNYYFPGALDDFRIYNRALAASEVQSLFGAPDTDPPTVSLTAPAAGATISGTVSVSANASDNVGVSGVQFKLDGANLQAEDTTAPYSISWNTNTTANSAHTLAAVARDAAGNLGTAANVNVTVNNDATPPIRSAGFPSGFIASGTTQATFGLTTNESGTCKFSTTAGVTYASMPSTFATTGSTSHSSTVTGLTNGSTYTYYVKCRDTAQNANTDDHVISFSLLPKPVAYWKFNETSGTTAADSSGNANTGTLMNGPVWTTTGKVGGALSFDGVNDSVGFANTSFVNITGTQLTLSAWVNIKGNPGAGSYHQILGKDSTQIQYRLLLNNVRNTLLFQAKTASGQISQSFAITALPLNAWQLITVTYNGSNVSFYVNGQLKGSRAETASIVSTPDTGQLGKSFGTNYFLNGLLDDVRIYNKALSSAQISAIYASPALAEAEPESALPETQIVQAPNINEHIPPTFVFTRPLAKGYGHYTADLFALQDILFSQGFLSVTPTGYFGDLTERAVKKLQGKHTILQTGIVGPLTRHLLNSLFGQR